MIYKMLSERSVIWKSYYKNGDQAEHIIDILPKNKIFTTKSKPRIQYVDK